jgi:hypothetical protein
MERGTLMDPSLLTGIAIVALFLAIKVKFGR